MRRNVSATIALAVLLVASGCLGAVGEAPAATGQADRNAAQPADQQPNRTISVAADGSASAAPDQAVVRVGVETEAEDAATARQRLAENASSLREGLAEAGVDAGQITTSGYDIRQPRRDRSGYVARQRFTVTVTDPDRAGEVIDAAVASGANRVDGVQFTLSPDRREELQQRALEDAMERARNRADTAADSANLRITGVHSVTTSERGHRPVRHEMALAAGDGASTNIDTGAVSVSTRVEVVYEAEQSG